MQEETSDFQLACAHALIIVFAVCSVIVSVAVIVVRSVRAVFGMTSVAIACGV